MNFYNPYYYIPASGVGRGLFRGAIRGGINWSGILNGAQRTLNLVNQAIPLVKQAAPMMRNAKTMFKVMNEFKKVDTPVSKNSNENNVHNSNTITEQETTNYNRGPTFFL